MLTKTSSKSPGAGFNGAFYEVPRRAPSDEYSQVTQGTRFEGGVGKTFEDFKQTDDFGKVKQEFAQQAERLKKFAHQNNPQNALHIVQQLDNFLRKFEDGSFLGIEEPIYGEGKGLFDRFCAQIEDDSIPLDKRLAALNNLAQRLGYCGFGIISEIQQAVFDLSLSGEGLHQQALDSHRKLVDAALINFAKKMDIPNLRGMEIHYVNEFKRRLGFPDVAKLPIDKLVSGSAINARAVERAQRAIKDETGPCQVALLTAETCLQSLRSILPTPFTMEQLQTAVEQLTKQFGPIPFNAVAQYDKDSNQYSLVAFPNLLAKSFLESLAQSGYCSKQIADRILSWTTDDQASRSIFCQKDTIPYVEVTMGQASELYNVTNEDLTQLYREVSSNPNHVQLPNEKTLCALCLSAIEAAEPGQLAHFDFEWMRRSPDLLNLFLRKCPPDEFRSWVNDRLTPDQRGDLFGILGSEASTSKFLDAVGPKEAGRILNEWKFEDMINDAMVTHNGPLLKTQFEFLGKTDHEYRKRILLETSANFPGLVSHRKNVKVLEQYLSILQQAKLDGVLNSADIVGILDPIRGKRKDGSPIIAVALEDGHARTLKALLDALPGLGLSHEEIVTLVTAQTPQATGFYLACQGGHAEALKVYLNALPELKLSPNEIDGILKTKSVHNISGIYVACQDGKDQALAVILDAIPRLKLTPEQIHELLKAKHLDRHGREYSALFVACVLDHSANVGVFLSALPSLKLTNEQILDLVVAQTNDGKRALQEAENMKHKKTAQVFWDNLGILKLSPTDVVSFV